MSTLQRLIEELCPEGVEYRELGSLLKTVRTGLNPRENFKLNVGECTNYYLTVKEISSGKIIFSDKTDRISETARQIINERSKLETGDVLLSGIGTIGKIAIVDIPTDNWDCSESVYLLKPQQHLILSKFLSHLLTSNEVQKEFSKGSVGSTLRGIRMSHINSIRIPVPPLPVQHEIVRILDQFTDLTAELTAELTARKQQYAYYRDLILGFDMNAWRADGLHWFANLFEEEHPEGVELKKFGDISKIVRGASPRPIINFVTDSFDGIHWVKIGDVKTGSKYISTTVEKITTEGAAKSRFVQPGDFIMSNSMSFGRPYIMKISGCIHDGWLSISGFEKNLLPDYLFHVLNSHSLQFQMSQQASNGTVQNLNAEIVKNLRIPVPSLKVQQFIVDVLDRFDALTSDLTQGLPAEIVARQQQYAYYRDQLLTFAEKPA